MTQYFDKDETLLKINDHVHDGTNVWHLINLNGVAMAAIKDKHQKITKTVVLSKFDLTKTVKVI